MSKPHMTYILVGEITVEVMLNLFPYHCLGYHHSVDLLYCFALRIIWIKYYMKSSDLNKHVNLNTLQIYYLQ